MSLRARARARKVAVLSLTFLLGACSKRQESTASLPDDLKKDLEVASASTLAAAPQSYQRMRFVSDIEQSRASVKALRPKISRHADRMTASHHASSQAADVASDPMATMASMSPAPVSTPAAAETEAIVVAAHPAPEPTSAPVGSSEGTASDHGRGGGLGGLLGGIFGGVVIRGGHAGPDKCDPRTDGRARGTITDRPDFGMPLPTGQPIFGGGRHR